MKDREQQGRRCAERTGEAAAGLRSVTGGLGRGRLEGEAPHQLGSSSWVSGRLAELLPLPLDFKQRLLETDEGAERLQLLRAALREKS